MYLVLFLFTIFAFANGSITTDIDTGENIATTNGEVPVVTCPAGKYRPQGRITGNRMDGCVDCPRGKYGSTPGLTLSTCTGECPPGKYGAYPGLTSIADCTFCPIGKYGPSYGLVRESQCVICPAGKYSDVEGIANLQSCKVCPDGYPLNGCDWPVVSRAP